jgi:hypothetical protein
MEPNSSAPGVRQHSNRGLTNTVRGVAMANRICSIEGCDRAHYARTWCESHYERWHRQGDPEWVRPIPAGGSDTKWCGGCCETLDVSRFSRSGSGWQSHCRECRRVRYAANNYNRGQTCADCGTAIANKATRCRTCHGKSKRGTPAKTGRFLNAQGYAMRSGYQDHANCRQANGSILEHVLVMSEMLGRPLTKGENVHHLNGVRDDNRPENLELWNTSQPAGQRVPDKVRWAKELLAMYEPEALAQPTPTFTPDQSRPL